MAEPRYLLDANICIFILDSASSTAVERLERCDIGEAVTSSIAYAEVMLGAVRLDGYDRAMRFFRTIPVLPFDQKAADLATADAALATAEQQVMSGSYAEALRSAQAAEAGLPHGSCRHMMGGNARV